MKDQAGPRFVRYQDLTEAQKKALRHDNRYQITYCPNVPICRHTKGKTSVFMNDLNSIHFPSESQISSGKSNFGNVCIRSCQNTLPNKINHAVKLGKYKYKLSAKNGLPRRFQSSNDSY